MKYPFEQSRSLLWKHCRQTHVDGGSGYDYTFNRSRVDYRDVYPMPTSLNKIHLTSTQQQLCVETIKNNILLTMCAGSWTGNVYHLGGLPGSGKTATITSLIEELVDSKLVKHGSILLCTKTNAATSNMFAACNKKSSAYFQESNFATVNSTFGIPVITTSSDVNNLFFFSII